ncbi:hypothetical protein BH09BAC3_BH09BAC3_21920 [soil metagenome]
MVRLKLFVGDERATFFWWLILLFVFSIPVSQFFSIRLLIVTLVVSFFIKGDRGKLGSQMWDACLYVAVLVIGLVYSEKFQIGVKLIETSLSLLILPIIFNKVDNFNREKLKTVFYTFASGLLIASLICLLHATILFSKGEGSQVFFFNQLTLIIDSQPTYFAYYLIAVITFGLYLLYYEETKLLRVYIILLVGFFLIMLLLTRGLTASVSLLFIVAFFLLKYLQETKTKRKTTTFGVVVVIVICMFAFNTVNREDGPDGRRNDYWERLVLWESALKATPNFMFGAGTGDYKMVLNSYYESHDLRQYAESNSNAHNQFIEVFLSNGLLGVISLLLLMSRPLYRSVRDSNILGVLIFFPFLIYGMTEVFLGRYQGVVFFALMHQTFLVHYLSYKPSFSMKDGQ